jgi:hypothetical protein
MTSVPNLKGFVFFPLISSQPGKPNHKLTILSQTLPAPNLQLFKAHGREMAQMCMTAPATSPPAFR